MKIFDKIRDLIAGSRSLGGAQQMSDNPKTGPDAAPPPLEEVKAGDLVIVRSSCVYGYNLQTRRVDRTTKTKIVVGNLEFRRTGRQVGSRLWNSSSIEQATPELLKLAARQRRIHKIAERLRDLNHRHILDRLDDKALDRLNDSLKAASDAAQIKDDEDKPDAE